jgi:site-specific DNA recombinase
MSKQAILYARVSTDEQARSGYSLAQQLEALRAYSVSEGYQVLEEIEDPGYSGAYLERPGLDRVRDLVADGGVSVVVAQDRDRFAREPAYLYLLREEFAEHGCKLKAMNDHGDDSPEGELTDGILDQLAKFERAKLRQRSKRGRRRRAQEGKLIPGRYPKYGFRRDEAGYGYEVDAERMALVHRVFHMIGEQGASLRSVAKTLDREGVPTPGGGKFWDRSVLKSWIMDDAYKPHTYEEVAAVVSPEAAAGLSIKPRRSGRSWAAART